MYTVTNKVGFNLLDGVFTHVSDILTSWGRAGITKE